MATGLTLKKSEGKKPSHKRVSPSQTALEETGSNRPPGVVKAVIAAEEALARDTASPEEAAPCTRSHVPNARTRKALRDADADKYLTEYADADDLFRELGITLGQEKV